jgi:heme oxygenase (biliverdin-IX-beta and delta-forming)
MTLRDRLRTDTRVQHERLEHRLAITRRIASAAEYEHLLKRLYGIYQPIERHLRVFLGEFQNHGLDLAQRFKTSKLEEDLRRLGYQEECLAELPLCAELPVLRTYSQAVGCSYVLEGATLGGQIIARQLREVLEASGDECMRFYRPYGRETANMWASFLAFLYAHAWAEEEIEQAVAAARETFECMEHWLLQDN